MIVQDCLHDLSHRDQLGALLTKWGMCSSMVEVGTFKGDYARVLLNTFPGRLYCIDPWVNQPREDYFDGANLYPMDEVFREAQVKLNDPRCTLIRAKGSEAVGGFGPESQDAVYLDGNHRLEIVRAELQAWWPRVKIGGILCGHDYNVRYDKDTDSDALTAVAEFAEFLGVRVHVTWCTSWYIVKTKELDQQFRAGIKLDIPLKETRQ